MFPAGASGTFDKTPSLTAFTLAQLNDSGAAVSFRSCPQLMQVSACDKMANSFTQPALTYIHRSLSYTNKNRHRHHGSLCPLLLTIALWPLCNSLVAFFQ